MNQVLQSAQTSIKKARKRLGLDDKIIDKLLTPEKIHQFNVSINLDNGGRKDFKGYRVQHNNLLGPYKGGIRFHPDVSKEEIQGLATLMTIKSAAIGLNFGGAKGGIMVDPKQFSKNELEKLSREYVRKIYDFIGPDVDIPAPDLNTNPQIIAWMVDEYIKLKVKSEKLKVNPKTLSYLRAAFTGKPLDLGGSQGRDEAAGRGGVIVLRALLAKSESSFFTIAVQGFGNVGYHFAKVASESGLSVVAISDSKGGITDKNFKFQISNFKFSPLDIPLVMECKREKGYVAGCYCVGGVCDLREGRQISNEDLLEMPVDILVPAALENVINGQNMSKIQAKIIVEMANGPITDEAYEYLTKKGIVIVPDIIANAGGVIVSYLEWLQNIKNERWDVSRVNSQLEEMLTGAFNKIWDKSVEENIPLKEAAYQIAIERLARSYTYEV